MELKVDLKKDGELLFVDLQGDLDINSNKEFKEKIWKFGSSEGN